MKLRSVSNTIFISLFVLFSSLLINPLCADDTDSIRYYISDSHLHFVDFLQETDGIDSLYRKMKSAGVDHIMINGLSLVKKWDSVDPIRPQYYLSDASKVYWYSATDFIVARAVMSLDEEDQSHFHPFICGFNPTDMNGIDHIKRMYEWYPDFWEGIGEIQTRHDDLSALSYGEKPRANHPALNAVYDFAAENDLPVSIHSNITSVWVHEPLYLHEIEEAIKNHPNTRFVWAHAGISRRIVVPSLVEDIRRMLNTYPNLWVDLSWVVYPMDVAPDHEPAKEWIELVEEFPDRFLVGTDSIGHFGEYKDNITRYYILLDALSPKTALLVARDNFLSILPKRVQDKL